MKTVDGAIYGLDYVPKTMIKFKIGKKEKKNEEQKDELNSRQTVIEITGVVIPLALLPTENLFRKSMWDDMWDNSGKWKYLKKITQLKY